MTYFVEWEESVKDFERHANYQHSAFSRWMSIPIIIIFVAESIMSAVKGFTCLSIASAIFAIFSFVFYYGRVYFIRKDITQRLEKAGVDKIAYSALLTEKKVIINNLTEEISTIRNYNSIWKIIEKKKETVIEVGHEYVCIDKERYDEDFQIRIAEFITGKIEKINCE